MMNSDKGESLEDKLSNFKSKVVERKTELTVEDPKEFLPHRLSRGNRYVKVDEIKGKVVERKTELTEEDLKELFLLRRLSRKDRSVEVEEVNDLLERHFSIDYENFISEVLEYREPETKGGLRNYLKKRLLWFEWENYDSYSKLKSKAEEVVEETIWMAENIFPNLEE